MEFLSNILDNDSYQLMTYLTIFLSNKAKLISYSYLCYLIGDWINFDKWFEGDACQNSIVGKHLWKCIWKSNGQSHCLFKFWYHQRKPLNMMRKYHNHTLQSPHNSLRNLWTVKVSMNRFYCSNYIIPIIYIVTLILHLEHLT